MAEGGSGAHSIELNAVGKRYGFKTVVRDIDLVVRAGESLVLVGHNGAGKTTLMKILLGLTRPSAGRVRVLDGDPASTTAVARRGGIGYLPESVAFREAMTGREVLTFYARLKGEPAARCGELLRQVGLREAMNQRVSTYSKGMRQRLGLAQAMLGRPRLGLAQAMLGRPRLLLLDEPTTGLDPALRRYFYEIIGALRETGTTVLISSHALHEVEARADRVVIMRQGGMVACGTLAELSAQAALPVRIRLTVVPEEMAGVAERLGQSSELRRDDDRTLVLSCPGEEKMQIVRRIAELGCAVHDVDITPPRLDEIYMHFMEGGRPQ